MGLLRKLYRRLAIAWHRPRDWSFRPGTFDRRAFRQVVVENEYRLPPRLPPGTEVLDIGANVGTFALAALRRGARTVHCFEPDENNFEQLTHNLRPFHARIRLHPCALWRSDRPAARLALCNPEPAGQTGAVRIGGYDGDGVAARAFDDVVSELTRSGRPLWVKLDCEGAEWPILFTSRRLERVELLCGEYHLGEWPEVFHVSGAPPCSPTGLAACLRGHGLGVEIVPHPQAPERFGHFFARRYRAVARSKSPGLWPTYSVATPHVIG